MKRLGRAEQRAAYLFLTPALVGAVIFAYGPIVMAFLLSFSHYSMLDTPRWIGLANYAAILQDGEFWQAVLNTAYFTIVSVPLTMGLALLVAIALNQRLRWRILARTLFYVPTISPMVAVALVWLWLYDPAYGVLNLVLRALGLPGVLWLGSTAWAMPSVIIMSVWKGIGAVMVIYLAGLQGIPEQLYEAAKIDGASAWQRLWYVTVPQLQPATMFILITALIGAFRVFDQVYVMTQGGPSNSTVTVVYEIYRNAFAYLRMGYASAEAMLLFVIILVFSLLNVRRLRVDWA
jgi:multiple sugar transport system permease protein